MPRFESDNRLLGLAWLGMASTDHVRRLWLPQRTPKSARLALNELRDEGMLQRQLWAGWSAGRSTPSRRAALWSLTRRGRALALASDQAPPEYKPPRSRALANHDATTVEAIVRVVELARLLGDYGAGRLSAIYVEREVPLIRSGDGR